MCTIFPKATWEKLFDPSTRISYVHSSNFFVHPPHASHNLYLLKKHLYFNREIEFRQKQRSCSTEACFEGGGGGLVAKEVDLGRWLGCNDRSGAVGVLVIFGMQ